MSRLHGDLNWLDDKQPAMQQLILQLCSINSGTFNVEGLAKVRDLLLESFSPLVGLSRTIDLTPYKLIDSTGDIVHQPLGQAIQIVKRPSAKKRVFLCIHMDTVYDKRHPFQACKLLNGNRMNGPGVADAKGGIVVMLYALRCLEASQWADEIGWEVILNPDEEIGSPSSNCLFQESAKANQVGLLFEPAYPDGSLVDRRKGSGNFAFVINGRSAHSGREFEHGRNAIVEAANIVVRINALNGFHSDVTLNVGKIEGGGPLNMVPDLAIVRVNVRVSEVSHTDWIQQEFDNIVHEVNRFDGFACQLHGSFSSPPKILDAATRSIQQHIDQCAAELNLPIKWTATGGASDGNKLSAAGLPNIDTLGVIGGNIHSDQEYVLLDSLVPRAKLVALLLMKYASGELAMP